ncbi:geranylgeranylglyceryl/heptaprenylglyceryl phosphate synthase [Tamlana fucoidanivorans]|uniref:geranylgeranylglyceryl/heptaprenylglyceryl phosphate synthase n=1 Tax=Allotamlana fucoidanivorans TaxID=2583814 RepID=UPI003892385D
MAVLIDPDKFQLENTKQFILKVNASIATHIFVGGSTVQQNATHALVIEIKKYTQLPIVLFPGDVTQITGRADALLFLSLISGRNPDYLIDKHVKAVQTLKGLNLEVIPTGYILIDGGQITAVERVTKTKPMVVSGLQDIANTAKAGQLLGMKLIYLEAGSGAKQAVSFETIKQVKQDVNIPLIVGGGIKSKIQINEAFTAGADMVVIGTAFEKDETFFEAINEVGERKKINTSIA